MRIIEGLLILLVMILFIATVNMLLIDYGVKYEDSIITYNRVLAYQLLNNENIYKISEKVSEYPNIVYVSVNSTNIPHIPCGTFTITVRGFVLGYNGTLNPSWVIVGVRP